MSSRIGFRWLALAWLGAAMVADVVVAQAPPAHTVLTIHWSDEDFPSNPVVDTAIQQVLKSRLGAGLEYYAEYLESDRFAPEIAESALREYIRRKYQDRSIDVVIANANPALQFALRYRDELFPSAPIVYYGQAVADDVREAGAGVTGVVRTVAYDETLKLALDLHPSTTDVLVVANSPSSSYLEGVRSDLHGFADRVRLTYINEPSVPRLIAALKAAPPHSVILYIRHSHDVPGEVMYPDEVARLAIPAAAVPVYITSELFFGGGAVGGIVRRNPATGELLGEMAAKILGGVRAQDLPLTPSGIAPIFDWRQLSRWGIDPTRLPLGSDIQFRVAGPWERYGPYIAGALVLMSVQAAMIAYMVVQRTRRRRSEARNTSILRALPDMMFVQNRDGVYLDYYAPSREHLLVPPEQFLNRHMREVLPPFLAAIAEERLKRLAPGQPPEIIEYSLPLADGERYYEARLVAGQDGQVLSIVRDITDRKRAEALLQASQDRYARATAAGAVAVWEWNLDSNQLHIDPVLPEILGYPASQSTEAVDIWWNRIHPDDVANVRARVEQHLRNLGAFYEVEHRMIGREGAIRWFVTRGSAVRDGGRAVRLVGTITDVTARKRSELALNDAQADLTRLLRLTALGELASSIGHEMRQPLATIRVITTVCQRWLDEPMPKIADVRQAMQDIADECVRAGEVIRRHGDLFRQRTVQKTSVDINSVILDVIRFLHLRLQSAHITLVKSLATGLPPVEADRIELQQLLINLVGNSIDAMDGIEPGLRRLKLSSELGEDHTVVVSVSDSGVGLAGVDQDRMFQPSYTTKVNGTGVGLSICRSIVEAHDGRLWAEQNPGVGATFSFSLPLPMTLASSLRASTDEPARAGPAADRY